MNRVNNDREKLVRINHPIARCYTSNEVHRKTDTLFPGNSMTVAELHPRLMGTLFFKGGSVA